MAEPSGGLPDQAVTWFWHFRQRHSYQHFYTFTSGVNFRYMSKSKWLCPKDLESKNKTRGKNMSEAFLPWLDKLRKLYNGSDGRDISDTDESQEWINKLRNRITQRKYNEKLNKDLYKLVSAASVNNLASNMLSEGYHCFCLRSMS